MSAATLSPARDETLMVNLVQDVIAGNTDLAMIAGMTGEEVEAVYSLGHSFFSAGKYDDALDVFRFLCMHRHLESRYWFGLGATCQMLGDHATAVKAYKACALLDMTNAQVPLRAAECFRALGDIDNMRHALEAVIILGGEGSQQAAYVKRARLMLAALDTRSAAA